MFSNVVDFIERGKNPQQILTILLLFGYIDFDNLLLLTMRQIEFLGMQVMVRQSLLNVLET